MLARLFFFLIVLTGCFSLPKIEGFDSKKWKTSAVCSDYRIKTAHLLEANELELQGFIQKEIDDLLGSNYRHELEKRNEQFFYYPVTVNCGDTIPDTSLLLCFDALGRVKEVLVVLVDS